MNLLLLKNSLLVSNLAALLAGIFGLMAALFLAGSAPRWRHAVLGLAIGTLALPPFLVTNCWLHFLGVTGTWRSWVPFEIASLGGTIWILALLLWPVPLLAVWSAWRRLESAHLEADPAVTGWHLFRGLLWPLARRPLIGAAVLTFVLALNNFAVPAILQVKVFPAEMWVRFNTTFDTWGALQLSWPLVVGPLLLLLWGARHHLPWPHLATTVNPAQFRRQIGAGFFWSSAVGAWLLCGLSVGLPLLQILLVSRTWTELPGALGAGQSALLNSVLLSVIPSTAVVGLSLVFAAREDQSARRPSRRPFKLRPSGLLWLPFLLPGVFLGVGWIALFNRPLWFWLYQSVGIVVLALVVRYLALGWTAVRHAAQSVDRDLLEVARLEGANWWQRLRHAQWPQIAPQAAAAWYTVFLLCLWDVESMVLIVPPGGETLSLRIFNLLHYGHNSQVNALCLTLLGVGIAPLLLWLAGSTWRQWRSRFPRCAFSLVLLSLLGLTSCSPWPGSEGILGSHIFSRVQIIGARGVGIGQFNKPRSVVVDAQDALYVVDMTGRVQKFSPAGIFQLSWQMPQTDRGKPKGMTRDGNGNVVVIEPHYSRVNHFSTAGKLVSQWGEHGTQEGQFGVPRAVAINSLGEIFVSEYQEAERLQKYAFEDCAASPGTGTAVAPRWLGSFGHAGTGPGEFNRPEGLCVDAQDQVYVADSCNHRIQIFSREGKFIRAYGRAGKGRGELSYPYDICVDEAGRQYVCEFGNSRIQVFDANDQPIEIIGGPGAGPGRFSNPWGLALDSAGNLYVADSQNHRVQKLMRTR